MRNWILILISLLFGYIVYGIFLFQYDVRIIPLEIRTDQPLNFYDYKGAVHVLSKRSTGSGSYTEILDAAHRNDFDFLIMTDLNEPGDLAEGYYGKLLTFRGLKLNYLNSRLLFLHPAEVLQNAGPGQTQLLLADLFNEPSTSVKTPVILAHPVKANYQWEGPYPAHLSGIEIVNLKQLWQRAWLQNKFSFFWSILFLPFNERLMLLRLLSFPNPELKLWNQILQSRPICGMAGSEAESRFRLPGQLSLEFPTYETILSLASNHLLLNSELTGNVRLDREKVLSALKKGQFYFALDILANPKGFSAFIESAEGELFTMGDKIKFKEGLKLKVVLPHQPKVPFDVEIIRDGQRMMVSNQKVTIMDIFEPGTYRVQIKAIPTLPLPDGKKWLPWIFSNPFFVLPPSS